MPTKRKRLFFDIETSPGVYWAWRPGFNINLSYKNLIKEPAVICVSWKWEGQKKIHHTTWDKNQCDKALLKKFIPVMLEADEVCGHNSDNFDIKWLRTRCLKHEIPMPPTFVSLDTWKQAKTYFNFNSNSLDYITKFLGLRGKRETGGSKLWVEITFNKCKKSMAKMVAYCDQDVDQQSQVFARFMPYVPVRSHFGSSTSTCPECGSGHVTIKSYPITAAGHKKVQFQCQECGKYHSMARSRFEKDKAI